MVQTGTCLSHSHCLARSVPLFTSDVLVGTRPAFAQVWGCHDYGPFLLYQGWLVYPVWLAHWGTRDSPPTADPPMPCRTMVALGNGAMMPPRPCIHHRWCRCCQRASPQTRGSTASGIQCIHDVTRLAFVWLLLAGLPTIPRAMGGSTLLLNPLGRILP